MSKQEIDVLYSDLKEGYAVLHGEYERLNVYHKKRVAELEEAITEIAVAYYNAQKEIRLLKNGGD